MNLNTYYKTLSEIHGELFTKREFSKKHMGKCETYYGYLKSTSSEPSKSALVNLWHQLRYDSGVLAEQAMRVGLAWVTEELKLQSETLNRLSGTVLEDIMLRQPVTLQVNCTRWLSQIFGFGNQTKHADKYI